MVEEKGAEGESDENVCKLGKVIRVIEAGYHEEHS